MMSISAEIVGVGPMKLESSLEIGGVVWRSKNPRFGLSHFCATCRIMMLNPWSHNGGRGGGGGGGGVIPVSLELFLWNVYEMVKVCIFSWVIVNNNFNG